VAPKTICELGFKFWKRRKTFSIVSQLFRSVPRLRRTRARCRGEDENSPFPARHKVRSFSVADVAY